MVGRYFATVVSDLLPPVRVVPYLTVRMLSATEGTIGRNEIEQQFRSHASRWRHETGMLSSPTRISTHPDYQGIIRMGKPVVPLILRELRDRGGQWYYALEVITGENPIPPQAESYVPQMKAAWLAWGQSQGYI
jgi:hypothetical protein